MCLSSPDLSTHACTCKSPGGLTEINKGSNPRLSHVVQRFNRRLSYVLVACHPVLFYLTCLRQPDPEIPESRLILYIGDFWQGNMQLRNVRFTVRKSPVIQIVYISKVSKSVVACHPDFWVWCIVANKKSHFQPSEKTYFEM